MDRFKVVYYFLLIWLVVSCGPGKNSQSKPPVRVKTEVASTDNSSLTQKYVGIVEENEATAVSFTSMGVVQRVFVSEGQTVAKGQLIAEMDPTTMSNSVNAAKATTSQAEDMVKQAENTYAQTKDAYERMKLLHDNGSLPEIKWVEIQTRLQQAETGLRTAKSGVKSAEATERIAKKGLDDTRIYAPVSGVIGRRQINAGETALPSQAVVTILDINNVKVKVSVPETEMSQLGNNASAYIYVPAIDQNVGGVITEKGVKADAMTHTYDVRVRVNNSGHHLLPGMVANVMFTKSTANPASMGYPVVPITSVQRKTDGSLFVWTIAEDSTAHRATVEIGQTIGNRVVVTRGLAQGQRVVTEGYQKLGEGSKTVY